ncbi:hypothetical protein KAZ01_00750 [Candidatus Gracilibacteria bacterium]|nr:hypothetical protein [Candidatus Gracilibacteria bacterium]
MKKVILLILVLSLFVSINTINAYSLTKQDNVVIKRATEKIEKYIQKKGEKYRSKLTTQLELFRLNKFINNDEKYTIIGEIINSLKTKKQKLEQVINSFEGGNLFKSASGSFYIVSLNGTFYDMGRQYGSLLKQQLKDFYKESVTDFLIGEKKIKYEDLVINSKINYNEFPKNFKDYLDGIADTSGLDKNQVYIMSSGLVNTVYADLGCSSLSAWGDYTTDGNTITGRNLDLPGDTLRKFGKYFHIVIWNPVNYPSSVASIDLMGGLFYQTAFNNKGIFLELQNGENADTSSFTGRINTNNILLESLFRNTTSKETDNWFNTILPEVGLIMNGSFKDHATIYEWSTFRAVPRNATGLISASNDFIDESWKDFKINFFDKSNEGAGYTVTRRTNLLNLGESNKGNITPQKMMEIFDTTIPSGGATFPENGQIKTIYSVVAQPGELKMWLKVRGYSTWEEIDLKKYFNE